MCSTEKEKRMNCLEEENFAMMDVRNAIKGNVKFMEVLECPTKPYCLQCSDRHRKLECLNNILAFLEFHNKKINPILLSHYKIKIFENFNFAKELIKYLMAECLENCYLNNQSLSWQTCLFDLQSTLNFLSSGEINILTYYTSYVRKNITSYDSQAIIEAQMLKYLKIVTKIPDECVIKSFELTISNFTLYEDLAHFLKMCCENHLNNGSIVTNLLKIIFKMHLKTTEDESVIKHTDYPSYFLNYILHICDKEGFELSEYVSKYCNTVWNFQSKISITGAAAEGDLEGLRSLLNSGFDVYPEEEQRKAGYLTDKIPRHHQIILEVMRKIIQKNRDEIEELHISQDQVKCFRMMWQFVASPEVTSQELYKSIEEEFKSLSIRDSGNVIINGSEIQKFYKRRRDLRRFARLYKKFYITSKSEPCSLFKLCRIQVRKHIRDTQRHLRQLLSHPNDDQTLIIEDLNRIESKLILIP